MNPNYRQLAELLVHHSTKVKANERVFIDASETPEAFVLELCNAVHRKGAQAFVKITQPKIERVLLQNGSPAQFSERARHDIALIRRMDAYIAIRGALNIFENADVPATQMKNFAKAMRSVQTQRIEKTRWVVLRWPHASMAQQARMSTAAFEKFFFEACTFNYAQLAKAMQPLKNLMDRTDKVHIQGAGTDLRFSIKNIPSVSCAGVHNVPDGEVFTAPVKNSVEGQLSYNTPTTYNGVLFENIVLQFKKGRIVELKASRQKEMESILNTDAGARYIGEFAIGVNPIILEPMGDTLFDEKIAGSFHFTPGQAYKQADNKNRSQVHWDMVCIQRPEYGGGTIHFDGKLIRKNGLFVPKNLQKLNPKALLKATKATRAKKA